MIEVLTKGASSVNLNAAPYHVAMEQRDYGGVPRATDVVAGDDLPRFGRTRHGAARLVPYVIEVSGADRDALEANKAALLEVLPDDDMAATLTIGPTAGSTTGELTARAVDGPIIGPYTFAEDVGYRAQVSFVLACDPYVVAPTETLADAAAVTTPAAVSLAAQTGQFPAPLDLLVSGSSLVAIYAARYPDAAAPLSRFVIRAVNLSWSGGAAAPDAAGYPDGVGNTLWGTASTGGVSAAIDVTGYEPGEYHLFCRGKSSNAAGVVFAQHQYGRPVRLTGTTLALYHLGVVTLPTAAVRGAGTATLAVTLTGDGTHLAYANTFVLLPASLGGCVGWRSSVAAGSITFADGIVYAGNVAALADAFGAETVRGLGGALVIVAERTPPAPTTSVNLTVTDKPRHEQFPAEGGTAGPGI